MRDKRWRGVMMAVMTVLAVVMFIPMTGQTAASEQIVTVYKTPT